MRSRVLTFVRLGPSFAYALAAALLLSMLLLARFPSSAMVWSLYMTILPAVREPAFLLLDSVGIVAAVAALLIAAAVGVPLAVRPEFYVRTRFIHAHVALVASMFGVVRASSAQAGLSGLSLPQLLRGDWSLLPMSNPALWIALFLLLAGACLSSHAGIIGRIRRR
ncbi:hypothetical protein SJ05684_c29670 [Sinorhizobium sojae CCBAU 05684]|uniref:Transmembrane protein n=1 Tax=Sinorhizobium sojae CCBAU 05684 TaxID=716928 RepID=A0A249PFC5_9HYPH|nr:hypothetical protein [Sinorhizobium sojae]ASY64397.1 hypothetical protein SJ05684_c29670 [Sinorhizobium sojae CCBAU 05684]